MSDDAITLRPAQIEDVPALDAGLRALSATFNDTHRATPESLAQGGFGPNPSFRAVLAEYPGRMVSEPPLGVVLFSPFFSTTGGGPGTFVSDLWVAEAARRQGLARRLLAAAHGEGKTEWGGSFLRLYTSIGNQTGLATYHQLGFTLLEENRLLMLASDKCEAL